MKEHIEGFLDDGKCCSLRLKDPAQTDLQLLEMARQDASCLPCTQDGARFVYDHGDMVSLEHFLDSYSFEGEEGYGFLIHLFEQAIHTNRAKPVLFEPDAVFVSRDGSRFGFVVLPLKTELWLLQKEKTRQWCRTVRKLFKTHTAFEIAGFLMMFENAREFSMPAMVQGLRDLHRRYHPRKWPFLPEKPVPAFVAREPVEPYQIAKPPEPVMEKTRILAQPEPAQARLEWEGQTYPLPLEQMRVGRGMQCDIRLEGEDVSLVHAIIWKNEDRYYITDQKSSNGTWLGEKRVQRKMRLKPGMQVRFGSVCCTFEQ